MRIVIAYYRDFYRSYFRGRDGYWWVRHIAAAVITVIVALCWLNLVGLVT